MPFPLKSAIRLGTLLLITAGAGVLAGWLLFRPGGRPHADANFLHHGGSTPQQRSRSPADDLVPASDPSRYSACWAVVIGVNGYRAETQWSQLKSPVNDATAIASLLSTEFGYSPQPDGRPGGVKLLVDGDNPATRKAIEDAIVKWLPQHATGEDDCALVYFAGHGLVDKNEAQEPGYIAAIDSAKNDYHNSCISVEWLITKLEGLNCRHRAIILDSCYSGALFRKSPQVLGSSVAHHTTGDSKGDSVRGSTAAKTNDPSQKNADGFRSFLRSKAYWGLASGRNTLVADSVNRESHSVFSRAILDAMIDRSGSERPHDVFTFSDMAQRVSESVERQPGLARELNQLPISGRLPSDPAGEFLFIPTFERETKKKRLRMETKRADRERALRIFRDAWSAWQRNECRYARELLYKVPLGYRDWEWECLARIAQSEMHIVPLELPTTCLRLSGAVGQVSLFVARGRNVVTRVGLANDRVENVALDAPDRATLACWDDEGSWVGIASESVVSIVSALDGKAVSQWSLESPVTAIKFAGKALVVGCHSGDVHHLQREYPDDARILSHHHGEVTSVASDNAGRYVASCGNDAIIRIFDRNQNLEQTLKAPAVVHSMTLSKDCRYLAACGETDVFLWDLDDQSLLNRWPELARALWFDMSSRMLIMQRKNDFAVYALTEDRPAYTIQGQEGPILVADFDAQRAMLAAVGEDRCLRVWGLKPSGAELAPTFESYPLAISSGNLSLAEYKAASVILTNGRTGDKIPVYETKEQPVAVRISPDSRIVAVVTKDKQLHVIDSRTHSSLWSTSGTEFSSVVAAEFSPQGDVLAIGCDTGEVIFRNSRTGEKMAGPLQCHQGRITSLRFDAAGDFLAVTVAGKNLDPASAYVWSRKTGKLLQRIVPPAPVDQPLSEPIDCDFDSSATRLAIATQSRGVSVWELSSGQLQQQSAGMPGVNCVRFIGLSRLAVGTQKECAILDVSTSRKVFSLPTPTLKIVPDSDGRIHLISHNSVTIWNGSRTVRDFCDAQPSFDASVSGDGRSIVMIGTNSDQASSIVRSFNLQSMDEVVLDTSDELPFVRVIMNLAGDRAYAVRQDGLIRCYDVTTRRVVWNIATNCASPGAFAIDRQGKVLAVAGTAGRLVVIDAVFGNAICYRGRSESYRSCAFSPAAPLLAVGTADGTIEVLDQGTLTSEIRWAAHHGIVNDLAFSPEGKYLVSAGEDCIAKIWLPKAGREIAAHTEHSVAVRSVAWCDAKPSDRFVTSIDAKGTLNIWEYRNRPRVPLAFVVGACSRESCGGGGRIFAMVV